MPAEIAAGASFRGDLRNEVLTTYRRQYQVIQDRLSLAMALDFSSNKRSEFYFYWEAAPHIGRWAYGDTLPFEGFQGIQFEVQNHRWAKGISWFTDDREDDTTGSLMQQARGLGESAAWLDERVLFQFLNGSTDLDLVPSIPNAPDGLPIHSTTARFGSADNSTAGTIADETNNRAAFWLVMNLWRTMEDGNSQPLLDPNVIDGTKLVIFDSSIEDAFAATFRREQIAVDLGTEGAGASDEIRGAGHKVILWSTSRVETATEAFYFLGESQLKAVFSQLRSQLQEDTANASNSDIGRIEDKEYLRFKMRKGFGVALPYATVQIT